ncbi:MAG: hypothetical protein PHD02_01165 [Bacilli bacterium]|nr:hypothetical protein [Bacilli bacterium]
MSKGFKVAIVLALVAVGLFVTNMLMNNNKVKISNTDSVITIESDTFPSIYSLIGERNITNVEEGINSSGKYIWLTYDDVTLEDASLYIIDLADAGYYLDEADQNNAVVVKESSEDGYVMSIEINYDSEGTIVKYSRGAGTITQE